MVVCILHVLKAALDFFVEVQLHEHPSDKLAEALINARELMHFFLADFSQNGERKHELESDDSYKLP